MPLNTLRLNHQISSHPNDRIVFIKPLPRTSTDQASYDTADLILRAIAAQCLPVMKCHYLSVTTLEEHEPNPEFIGRNFNNGEIIQLVLKTKNGIWLPVNVIQMVMMHELAHNVHMNHGKGFWATRNKFAEEMKELWAKGYTGDGLWGTGRTVGDLGRAMNGNVVGSEQLKDLPLCGGTFRSRGRKRKRVNEDLTWREKRDRRIAKKFGTNGVALGEDDAKRLRLDVENKGLVGVKPRVAQSKRGRELRAAAALARFGGNKQEVGMLGALKHEYQDTDEDESEWDEDDANENHATDTNGQRLLDGNGKDMIRVCDAGQADAVAVKQEMDELEELSSAPHHTIMEVHDISNTVNKANVDNLLQTREEDANKRKKPPSSIYHISRHPEPSMFTSTAKHPLNPLEKKSNTSKQSTSTTNPPPRPGSSSSSKFPISASISSTTHCPICSMENSSLNPTCLACANVLDSRKDPRHWRCQSTTCKGSQYINAGDCGICGICNQRRLAPSQAQSHE